MRGKHVFREGRKKKGEGSSEGKNEGRRKAPEGK